jgi:NADPH2:quinone reductase
MKLILFREPGPPSVLQCLDVPVPEPKPGEVLIRAHAIGVGIPDTLIRAGTYSWMPPLPATPGTELSGTIEKVGPGVAARRPGQRVYASARERPHRGGHYAEYVATPAEATFVLPDDVDFDTAATLANYQVAYHLFNDAVRPRHGQSVLIYAAAGGMGNALIDLAKAAGLVTIGVVSSAAKVRFARELGADHVIDRKAETVSKRVDEIAGGRGVDIIVDPVGGPSIPGNLELLAPCGMLVVYGGLGGKAPLDLQTTMRSSKNSPAIRQFSIHTWDHLVEERRTGMRALIDMLAAGKLHPRIYARLPLAEAVRAHEMLESGTVLGKLLLIP